MNILLPESFESYDKDGSKDAEIINNVLYLYRSTSFKKVMYELAYKLRGTKCYYCKTAEATTIDHGIPQAFGGPTITDNLFPACANCNNLKTNMYINEFMDFLSIDGKKERKDYLKSLKKVQDDRLYGVIPSLPEEWILKEKRNVIWVKFFIDEPLGAKHKKLLSSLNYYKKHKTGIVLTQNNVLVDGFNTVFIGKSKNQRNYYQILLENVVVVFKGEQNAII